MVRVLPWTVRGVGSIPARATFFSHFFYNTVKQLRKFSFSDGLPLANVHRCLADSADVLNRVTAYGSA